MKQGKKVGLDVIVSEIKKGLKPTQIGEKYNIPSSTLGRSLDKLKEMECIEKVGYGTWKVLKEVPNRLKDTLKVKRDFSKKDIRGHAFIWNIEFLEGGFDWKQIVKNYKKRYKKPTLTFRMICGGKVPRTIFKKRKIWLTKAGLTIYEPLDFFGDSAFRVKGNAVFEMDRLVKDLIKKLGLRMQFYRFKCSREHFAHVKNQMARQFNDKKQRIKVEFDGKHFWIDHSDGVDEEETDDPNVSVQAQKFYKSQVKTMFKFTPEVIAGLIKGNAEGIANLKGVFPAMKEYNENLKLHTAVQQAQLKTAKENGKTAKETREIFKDIRDFMRSGK